MICLGKAIRAKSLISVDSLKAGLRRLKSRRYAGFHFNISLSVFSKGTDQLSASL